MRDLIFWGVFPFVLPQALYVRRTAPRFRRAGGPHRGAVGRGPVFNLIAVGDSIIAGVGARKLTDALVGRTAQRLAAVLSRRVCWKAYGRIGAGSRSIRRHLVSRLPPGEADGILLSVGVNDVTSLSRLTVWRRNLGNLLTALGDHSPRAVVAVAGIPPLGGFPLLPQPLRALFGMRAATFDRAARQVIARYPFALHVPLSFDPRPEKFAADGYHPSEDSYVVFGQMMADAMAARLHQEAPAAA